MKTTADFTNQDLVIFAHELRQPVASILLAVQCMNEAVGYEPGTREMCQIVERQSRFLVRMIEQVLDERQRQAEDRRSRKVWFDLGSAVAAAIEATGSLLKERASRLMVALPPEPLWMHGDPLSIQQILINLLSNAAKYTEPGGRIRLCAEVVADSVVIEVSDNGIGISEALLPSVFDLFARGAEAAGSRAAGLGIGLALVKSLVDLHAGTITAQSDGAGTGSTFTVRLPETEWRVHRESRTSEVYSMGTSTRQSAATSPIGDA